MILNNTNNKIMTVIKELPEKVHEKFLNFISVKNFIAIDERRNQTKVGISIYLSFKRYNKDKQNNYGLDIKTLGIFGVLKFTILHNMPESW